MVVVAIVGLLAALAMNGFSEMRRAARVSGQARLLMQRLQSARTQAVKNGNAQGYYIAANGPGALGPDANTAWGYVSANATATNVSYNPPLDRILRPADTLPSVGPNALVTVTGPPPLAPPAPFDVGFDMNGLPTVTPAPLGPPPLYYCIQVSDPASPTTIRWVILFNDGTVKVQRNEQYCP
jgi:type II secretory pathway pseudopilin PulG